ncbi:MAG: methionine ABC transporter ATP-binding protein [Actinomycetaceae bacterium]|nr:methionine ABC transporter ATP-binding protein [Actinomycetaceae bacterium]
MIQLKNVRKVYPRRGAEPVVALNGIDLTIPAGDIHGIVGQSGAGKSTLIRCLTALERPTEGEILVDGDNLAALSPTQLSQARRKIGMVFQGGNLLDSRTASQNIAYPLKIAGVPKSQIPGRVDELLAVVGLADRGSSYPSQLSGGQRQRVAIARALATNPAVLLCDEPTSALDTETTNQILDLLASVRESFGVTVLIITHEMSVVRRICRSVTLLDHGSIAATGSVESAVSDVDSLLSKQIVPKPHISADSVGSATVIDVAFTSRPGEPTGANVLKLAAELRADVSAGTFETIGSTQVSRLALTIDNYETTAADALKHFGAHGIVAEVRQ